MNKDSTTQNELPQTAAPVDVQAQFSGTQPVAERHAFDEAALLDWMRGRIDGIGEEMQVEQFKGGQSNPTFRLSTGGRAFVLRRKPPGVLLPSAHAVEREYRVIRALSGTEVPVARAHALCEDASVIGSPFYIMDNVDGRIFWDPTLPGQNRAERAAIFDEMNRVIAALHSIDPVQIGLADYGKPGNYMERQVARWTRQYRAAETEPIEAADRLIDWLPRHLPASDDDPSRSRIVHGDYRLDNVIFHPTQLRIIAVLDWELSTLGDPLADFAYHCMTWRMSGEGSRGLAGVDLGALGIPSEADYLQRYLQRVRQASHELDGRLGDSISDATWAYYMVFNMFRLVGILQGVAARAQQGNASNSRARDAGRRARPLAEQAWALAQQIAS
ncbi:phosphotransferase family protein [Piscinibacter sakaiensis]|uniref:phosphotransferase family protein n=1 Tax=Piscinibacter sakaiensis TaxID=1547922 RepID=UPI003AAF2F1D